MVFGARWCMFTFSIRHLRRLGGEIRYPSTLLRRVIVADPYCILIIFMERGTGEVVVISSRALVKAPWFEQFRSTGFAIA